MQRREVGTGSDKAHPVDSHLSAGHVRFRTESEMGMSPLQRRWQATYSYGEGWSRFKITVDLSQNTCTLFRTPDADYTEMLRELAGKTRESVTPLPPPTRHVESLTFDVDIIGLKMSQVSARAASSGPAGDWLVVQAYLPGSSESFLLGVSNRLSAGEIVIPKPEAARAVLQALSQVFG